MRLFDNPFKNSNVLNKTCCSLDDVNDARKTCSVIGARHYYTNMVDDFKNKVMNKFVTIAYSNNGLILATKKTPAVTIVAA